ncbi:MAG TPA: hypothetical protein VF584_08860 [Longimicrobium sp.]|jgi:hypothetical protein
MSIELEGLGQRLIPIRSHEAQEVLGGTAEESGESQGGYTYVYGTTTVPGGGTESDRYIGDEWS